MIIQLPLTSDTSQTFTILLGAISYDMAVRWNDRSGTWVLDITDSASQTILVQGIPLVLGTDILSPYGLAMGYMVVVDQSGQGLDAGVDDLGSRVNVYWYSADTVAVA